MANREILEVDITEPEMGWVGGAPLAYYTRESLVASKGVWKHNDTGYFNHGTKVTLLAVPYEGYRFEKWSGEVPGGVSYSQGINIYMTENRNVKCHFRVVEVKVVLLANKQLFLRPVVVTVELLSTVRTTLQPVAVGIELLDTKTMRLTPVVAEIELLDSGSLELAPTDAPPPPPPPDEDKISWWIWIGLAVVAVLVVILVARKKK